MSSTLDSPARCDAAREEIRVVERRRCEALLTGDVETLSALVSEDLVHIHGNGQIDGKDDYLLGVAHKYIFHRIDRGALNIRVYGSTAVVVGLLEQTIEARDSSTRNDVSAVVSQTWVRSTRGWQQNTCHMHFLSLS